jgi:hypothetical protein
LSRDINLFIGAMAARALAEYDFRGSTLMALSFHGHHDSYCLGTVGILRLMVDLKWSIR